MECEEFDFEARATLAGRERSIASQSRKKPASETTGNMNDDNTGGKKCRFRSHAAAAGGQNVNSWRLRVWPCLRAALVRARFGLECQAMQCAETLPTNTGSSALIPIRKIWWVMVFVSFIASVSFDNDLIWWEALKCIWLVWRDGIRGSLFNEEMQV